jgi:hypothetical protein
LILKRVVWKNGNSLPLAVTKARNRASAYWQAELACPLDSVCGGFSGGDAGATLSSKQLGFTVAALAPVFIGANVALPPRPDATWVSNAA